MQFLDEKGQEEAPFELLVAVVIMGFVLVAGYMAMQDIQDKVCRQKINKLSEDFRAALEEVVIKKGSVDTIVDFPNDCYSDEDEDFFVVHVDNEYLCENFCSGIMKNCVLLSYTNPDFGFRKCLSIPAQTNYPSQSNPGPCPIDGQFEKFVLQDLSEDIPQGRYMLLNKSITGGIPTICAYKKERV